MSRIDEALRRAAGSQLKSDAESQSAARDRLWQCAATEALEAYDTEARHETERTPVPEPELRRPTPQLPSTAGRQGGRFQRSASAQMSEARMVLGHQVPHIAVERYRRLAAVLQDFRLQHGLTRLMVSSALPREGKTMTVVNLALTLSESYHQKVLLIDADLRRPSVHEVLGIPNRAGLADLVLTGGKSGQAAELSPCLHVLTAGHPQANPLAMLTSERVAMFVEEAAGRYDWVLLDTPPVGLLPDAQLVARLSEGVIFVIAAGATPYQAVRKAIDQIGKDRIVGTVLNRVKQSELPTGDYGSYFSKR